MYEEDEELKAAREKSYYCLTSATLVIGIISTIIWYFSGQ